MKKTMIVSLLAASINVAMAGGLESSNQSISVIFEQGRYVEAGLNFVSPSVSGKAPAALGGTSSGNMTKSFNTMELKYRAQLSPQLSYAVIFDQPITGKFSYKSGTNYPFAGSNADLTSLGLTGVLRYHVDQQLSLFGGLRGMQAGGDLTITPAQYNATVSDDIANGYLFGFAFEQPMYAARVAITYNSALENKFDTQENFAGNPLPKSVTELTTLPESINLEFQTGIMQDTLLLGSIRWVKWSDFNLAPIGFLTNTGGSILDYENDITTYQLGVGRRFSENWSGVAMLGYEAEGNVSNLNPTDGFTSYALGAAYTIDNIRVSAGMQYRSFGDGQPLISGLPTDFSDNNAWATSLRVGYTF